MVEFTGYFDAKYMKVLRIEQILHNFEDQKIAIFVPRTGRFSPDTRQIDYSFSCYT